VGDRPEIRGTELIEIHIETAVEVREQRQGVLYGLHRHARYDRQDPARLPTVDAGGRGEGEGAAGIATRVASVGTDGSEPEP
jgi:hypothetical protein